MNWLEGGRRELPPGQVLKLRYRVVVHTGDTKKADIAGIFEQYKQPPKSAGKKQKSPNKPK